MADVSAFLRSWSATASSNGPQDSATIGSGLGGNIRATQAVVRQFLASQGTPIASAATMDLTTMDGYYASVTGNTTVTGLGTEVAGISYWLRTASTPLFKYNASTLLLPGAADITAVAGDIFRFTSEGSGVWICTGYIPFSYNGTGQFVKTGSPTFTGVPAAPTAAAGTSTTQLATTAFVMGISSHTVQVFTTGGSNDWAKPANLKHVIVECLGGGGGGGGVSATANGAGGGGAGGYTRKLILASSVAASVTATVGAAGAAGGAGNNNGGTGGLSAFQGFCTAPGGVGGTSGISGFGAGGAGGVGVNGSFNGSGASGDSGLDFAAVGVGGQGGSSFLGGGGIGISSGAGGAGTGKGAGGAGAGGNNSGALAGGAGTAGIVIVWEFYT